MAQKKHEKVLDWYGNPIPEHKIPKPQEGVKGETGADGRKYLRPWDANGKPGKRVPLEDSYLVIHDNQGRVVYDYRVWPPEDAKIEPGYVGFLFEEILKSYFGESYADLKAKGCLAKTSHENRWIETTEDGEQYWRWNIIWMDRLPIAAMPALTVSERNESGTFETTYNSQSGQPQLAKVLIQRFRTRKSASKLKSS